MTKAVLFLHVASAIVAVGANATYGLWMARAAAERAHLEFTLRTVKRLDDWVANPAYIVAFLSGAWLAHDAGIPFSATWILGSIVLWATAMGVAYGLYTPLLRRQIAVVQSSGPDSDEYKALSRRGQVLGALMFAMAIAIVVLMVWRPA